MTRFSQRARRTRSGDASFLVCRVDARPKGRIDIESWNDCSMHGLMVPQATSPASRWRPLRRAARFANWFDAVAGMVLNSARSSGYMIVRHQAKATYRIVVAG